MSESAITLPSFGGLESLLLWLVLAAAAAALLYGWWLSARVLRRSAGPASMQNVAAAIQEGARAYLTRQFRTMALFIVLITIALYVLYRPIYTNPALSVGIALAFLMGCLASYGAGSVGMQLAVRGNVRTAYAATRGFREALETAFQAGTVSGMFTVGLGLLGATIIFVIFRGYATRVLIGFEFGGSLVASFMRIGGGIYTKAADVGADLVGKVEAGIPEDDPRNPATIADNVGDNVGDCAGMAADVFESYEVTTVATMVLAAIFFRTVSADAVTRMMTFPLAIGGVCIIASIIGTFFVKLGANQSIMGALYKGMIATAILSLIGIAGVVYYLIGFDKLAGVDYTGLSLFECGVVGLAVTALIIWITEYYTGTDFRPVKSIAAAS